MLINTIIQKTIKVIIFLNNPVVKTLVMLIVFAVDFATGGHPPSK